MSTESAAYDDASLRDRFATVVVSATRKGVVVHVPDPCTDDTEPLCSTADRARGWRETATSTYPPGTRRFCRKCADRLRERDEAERHPMPTWVVLGEGEVTGSALDEEW